MAWYRAHVKSSNNVLLVWKAPLDAEEMQGSVDALKDVVGQTGEVRVENFDFVENSLHPSGSFDVILSGVFSPFKVDHAVETLTTYLRLLKPGGSLVLCERDKKETMVSKSKIAGFTVEEPTDETGPDGAVFLVANKPNFDIGSSVPLKLPSSGDAKKLWSLDADDLADDDLIDPNTLLTEEDKKKPEGDALKVCGTTGKRKACKDCSCGLAEELNGGKDE